MGVLKVITIDYEFDWKKIKLIEISRKSYCRTSKETKDRNQDRPQDPCNFEWPLNDFIRSTSVRLLVLHSSQNGTKLQIGNKIGFYFLLGEKPSSITKRIFFPHQKWALVGTNPYRERAKSKSTGGLVLGSFGLPRDPAFLR